MQKIMILGSSGMAGHIIYNKLKILGYTILGIGRCDNDTFVDKTIDLRDLASVKMAIEDFKPECIINCAGILNHYCDLVVSDSIFINSFLPHWLSETFKSVYIIHLSTDCVFSGKKGFYKYDDLHDGETLYDRSKSIGEINKSNGTTIRTSIIGPDRRKDGIGLFNWFILSNKNIKGYANVLWSGITTLELSDYILELIKKPSPGIVQIAKINHISKLELLKLFDLTFRTQKVISPSYEPTINKILIPNIDYNIVSATSYSQSIQQMYEYIIANIYNYPHYNM